jgi:hypothetical protein
MLSYLFLLAAAAAPELPEINLIEDKEFQELIAVINQEIKADVIAVAEKTCEQKIESATPAASSIVIANAIEPAMLEYKHWTGKYSPEQFAITINGTEVEVGKTCDIPANVTSVEIGYTYSFMNGMKSGGRKISYQLNENTTQANITFDWKNDWRVIVDNGKAVKEIVS